MLSDSIVRDSRTLIQNTLLDVVPTKWLPQLTFGLGREGIEVARLARSRE